MKVKVIGVHSFPQKGSFKVLFDRPVDTPKMKSYGVGIITEKFCDRSDLLGRFTSAVGKEIDVSFDIRGRIDFING